MSNVDTARLIAYHDSVCFPACGEDISTYPIPPDDWEPPAPAPRRQRTQKPEREIP